MEKNNYLEQRRNRVKLGARIKLGGMKIIQTPVLGVVFLCMMVMVIYVMKYLNSLWNWDMLPNILLLPSKYAFLFVKILVPIIFASALLESVGKLTAMKDEMDIQEAFAKDELRNGCPILLKKKKVRGSKVTMREWYSAIPLHVWNERRTDISDSMNIQIVEELNYSKGNGRKIVMYSVRGREKISRGELYE